MKYLDEYRDGALARRIAAEIASISTRPWVLMEICGGQTHTIMRYGIHELLAARTLSSSTDPAARSASPRLK